MGRYYFHLRAGDTLTQDEEGTDLPDGFAARREAELTARELLSNAIKGGVRVVPDALVVADETGATRLTFLLATVLPIFSSLERSPESVINEPMSTDDEFRRQAASAERRASSTKNHGDREAWLRIAQGWMSLLRKRPQTDTENFNEQSRDKGTGQEDSDSSH
jgi:hypothetical protein